MVKKKKIQLLYSESESVEFFSTHYDEGDLRERLSQGITRTRVRGMQRNVYLMGLYEWMMETGVAVVEKGETLLRALKDRKQWVPMISPS